MDVIKTELKTLLEKSGHSLEDFEHALKNINTADGAIKLATLSKQAVIGELFSAAKSGLGAAGSLVGGLADIGILGTAGIGTALGAGALAIDRHLRKQDKKQKSREDEVKHMKDLVKKLQADK